MGLDKPEITLDEPEEILDEPEETLDKPEETAAKSEEILLKERLLNYITFVIMDQVLLAFRSGQNELHDTLLMVREKPPQITEILIWIIENARYIGDIDDILNRDLYEITLDGIVVVQQKYYTAIDSNEYATYCRKKYYQRWLDDQED